jgi:CubicO group peptidase (beta-lactamase class C family)
LNARLFKAELVEESLTPFKGNYGYGWQIRQFFDRDIYNHTGGIDGFSSHLAHYPGEGLTIVVLSNIEGDPAILRACDLAGRLFAWPGITGTASDERTPQQRCGLVK